MGKCWHKNRLASSLGALFLAKRNDYPARLEKFSVNKGNWCETGSLMILTKPKPATLL